MDEVRARELIKIVKAKAITSSSKDGQEFLKALQEVTVEIEDEIRKSQALLAPDKQSIGIRPKMI